MLSKSVTIMNMRQTSAAVLALIAIMVACCCWCCHGVDTEPSNVRTNPHSADEKYIDTPKRQYLISPRVGRSASTGSSNIWSPSDAGSPLQRGQAQPQRIIPESSKPSLLFLVGNPRIIGQRSTGLLPQARIGRRGGLMPQPRIGRRSFADNVIDDNDGERDLNENGQPEVATVALSDSSLFNALESMIEVVISADLPPSDGQSADTPIERPAHRATGFVPRLGKRGPTVHYLEHLLCPSGSQYCLQAIQRMMESDDDGFQSINDDNGLSRMIGSALNGHNGDRDGYFLIPEDLIDPQLMTQQPVSLYQSKPLAIQQLCRKAKEYPDMPLPMECSHLNRKRDAFIPRLG